MEQVFFGNVVLPDRILYGGTVRCRDGILTEVLSGEGGSIEVGKRADLCIVDTSLNVMQTVVGGRTVYERDSLDNGAKKGS